MTTKKDSFSSLEDLGKYFGINPQNKEKQIENFSTKTPFLGREKELKFLGEFIQNPETNIFGLYGVPMIGKSLLINNFIQNDSIIEPYTKIIIKFQNPENPQQTLTNAILHDKNIYDLYFEQPTLIVIQNFEECLEWTGSLNQLHNIRKEFPLITSFLREVMQLSNVKLILESRFQINSPAIDIQLKTLPQLELKGVDTIHFKELYEQEGVTGEEFELICSHFSNHTWLLSKAYQETEWLYRNVLNKAASRPQTVTTFLWDLLEKMISNLHKPEVLLLCALTLKSPIPYDDMVEVFEKQPSFKNSEVFENIDSLERKFLIQEIHDDYEINPYLREVCYSFLKRKRNREVNLLKSLPYFSSINEPKYNKAKQFLEKGRYGEFFKQIRRFRKDRKYEEAHDMLYYALEADIVFIKASILNEIGITYKKQKKYPQAIEVLEKAIKLKNIQSYNELATIYKAQEEYDKALEIVNSGLKLEPKNVRILNEKAIIHRKQEEYDKAIETLYEAFKEEPDRIESLNELAIIYKEQQEYDKAIKTLKRLLKYKPNDVNSLNELGIIYKEQQEYGQATEVLEKAIELGNIPSYNELAKVHMAQNKNAEALSVLERGLEIEPNNYYFKNLKRRILKILRKKNPASPKKVNPKSQKQKLKNLLSDDRIGLFLKEYLIFAKNSNRTGLQKKLEVQASEFSKIETLKNQEAISFEEYIQAKIPFRLEAIRLLKQFEPLPKVSSDEPVVKKQNIRTKILMLTANPAQTTKLSLKDEHSLISEKLEEHTHKFSLKVKRAINRTELKEITETIQPTILHFSGHGERRDKELYKLGIDSSGIVVQNDDKNGFERISAEKLDVLFNYFKQEFELGLVILNCCYSELQASAIAQHVPFVIGTTKAVTNGNAISFSVGFYFKFVKGNNVIRAFESGKTQAVLNNANKEDFIIFKNGQKLNI